MNYIKQLSAVIMKFADDDRLNTAHVSLYLALFQLWNLNRFKNPISINRAEVMKISKIGSKGTYHRCLNDFNNWSYLKYEPSHNPLKGSIVYMFNFETSTEQASVQVHGQLAIQVSGQVSEPSINNTKLYKTKETNKTFDEQTKNKKNKDLSFFEKEDNDELPLEKISSKKNVHSFPSSLQEVQVYFSEKKFPTVEAEKFFNHFESNGWLVGGRSKMRNWKAAANNWYLNSQKFNPKEKENHYHTNENKQFDIPL